VIIGFSKRKQAGKKQLWSYSSAASKPQKTHVDYINPYLLAAPKVLVTPRRKPLHDFTPVMVSGSKPADGGWISNLSENEVEEIANSDQIASKYVRRLIGGEELLDGKVRFCLWLVDVSPSDILASKVLRERVEKVKQMRLASKDKSTLRDSATPHLFQKIRQPKRDFLAIPTVSTPNREYVPMAIMPKEYIVNNLLLNIDDIDLPTFSILQSKLFMLWIETVSGRLGNALRFSAEITYNNFPFLELSEETKLDLTKSIQNVLEIRSTYAVEPLSALYNKLSMPADLRRAHDLNDKLVLSAYGLPRDSTDSQVLSKLFNLFETINESKSLS
jgi:hypothetical protein